MLSNFKKNMEGHTPKITVSAKETPLDWVLIIEDNGEGIIPSVKEKIFDMFFRGSPNSNGSGLGLYIAKEAADKIEAKITVASKVGEGSTFTVNLQKRN